MPMMPATDDGYEVRMDIDAVKRAHEVHKDPTRIAAIQNHVAYEKQTMDDVLDMFPKAPTRRFNNSTV